MLLSKKEKLEASLLLCVLFLCAVAVIWIRTSTVKTTYVYVHQERELRRLQEAMQLDRIKWLQLTAPKRLEKLAHNLGLAAPKMEQTLKIESDAKRGVK